MVQNRRTLLDGLVFLDACSTDLEHCRSGCESNSFILCRHRLTGHVQTIHTDHLVEFVRYFDFQVVLHFLYVIYKKAKRGSLAPRCQFVLVTKDKKFLHSARREWQERGGRRPNSLPRLQFTLGGTVTDGRYEIRVVYVGERHGKIESQQSIIHRLNEIFFPAVCA